MSCDKRIKEPYPPYIRQMHRRWPSNAPGIDSGRHECCSIHKGKEAANPRNLIAESDVKGVCHEGHSQSKPGVWAISTQFCADLCLMGSIFSACAICQIRAVQTRQFRPGWAGLGIHGWTPKKHIIHNNRYMIIYVFALLDNHHTTTSSAAQGGGESFKIGNL